MIMNIEQNTPAWHEWRAGGLGASDVPVVMAASPYKTPLRLWMEKTGQLEAEPIPEFLQFKGGEVEEDAKLEIYEQTGVNFVPVCATSEENDYFRASLDGYSDGIVLEVKFSGAAYVEELVNGGSVRPDHYQQMQYQMFCAGSEKAKYYVQDPNGNSVITTVDRDEEVIIKLKEKALEFKEFCDKMIEPPATDMDIVEVVSTELSLKMNRLSAAKIALDASKEEFEHAKQEVTQAATAKRMSYKGLLVTKSSRPGSLNYKKFLKEEDVDTSKLQEYRGKPSVSWLVKFQK